MYYAYAVKNKDSGKIYIGQTSNLERRIARHNRVLKTKKTSYTSKNAGSWKYIYIEPCETLGLAKLREKQLKSARGRKFIKQYCEGP